MNAKSLQLLCLFFHSARVLLTSRCTQKAVFTHFCRRRHVMMTPRTTMSLAHRRQLPPSFHNSRRSRSRPPSLAPHPQSQVCFLSVHSKSALNRLIHFKIIISSQACCRAASSEDEDCQAGKDCREAQGRKVGLSLPFIQTAMPLT